MKLGLYRHYKGKYYQLIGIAKHSETLEELATYYCLYPNKTSQLWVRPLKMFRKQIKVGGKNVKRFQYITSEEMD
ncbi:MAG TPA: DUF1653 domain-containing protein [Patescibacteria group bacterium]